MDLKSDEIAVEVVVNNQINSTTNINEDEPNDNTNKDTNDDNYVIKYSNTEQKEALTVMCIYVYISIY